MGKIKLCDACREKFKLAGKVGGANGTHADKVKAGIIGGKTKSENKSAAARKNARRARAARKLAHGDEHLAAV